MRPVIGDCPAELTLNKIQGRWKLSVLNQLFHSTLRYSELRRKIDSGVTGGRTVSVTPKMLTQELRQLENDGLINRQVYAQVPPKVEYSLTPLGRSLRPVLLALASWGREHGGNIDEEAVPRDDDDLNVK
jgi:DNA-binding HxlR family transcriptional regulator